MPFHHLFDGSGWYHKAVFQFANEDDALLFSMTHGCGQVFGETLMVEWEYEQKLGLLLTKLPLMSREKRQKFLPSLDGLLQAAEAEHAAYFDGI